MADCVTINREKVRAKLSIGGYVVETPDIKSFSVQVTRGNPIRTMSATLEVDVDIKDKINLNIPDPFSLNPEDMPVILQAGADQVLNTLFRGFIVGARVSPSWEKMDKILLNIQCKDAFYRLEGRSINRRNPFSRSGRWVAIRGIVRKSQSFEQPAGGRYAQGTRSGRPDIHLSGHYPSRTSVIQTPNIIDYSVLNPAPPSTKPDLIMEPELTYVTAGNATEVKVNLSKVKNNRSDYVNAVGSQSMDFRARWVVDNPLYASIEKNPDYVGTSDENYYAIVKINANVFPGTNFGVTFYSDQLDSANARHRFGRIVFLSVIPHTHESMLQGGPAFGTFS
jgi:hypothetical protein